jgi:hypothetical protein
VEVYYRPPGRYRWEYLSPDGHASRTVVSDGERQWVRAGGRVLAGDSPRANYKRITDDEEWRRLTQNYRMSTGVEVLLLGRPMRVVTLDPVGAGKPEQRVTVDKQTGVVFENRRTGADGFAVVTRLVRFDAGAETPESYFGSVPPEAVDHGLDPDFLSLEEMNRLSRGGASFPEVLADGFVFESADVFQVGRAPVRHVRYTDGLAVLSLFETAAPVGGPMQESLPDAGVPLRLLSPGTLVHWKSGGRYYTLMGDVSEDALKKISAGLR